MRRAVHRIVFCCLINESDGGEIHLKPLTAKKIEVQKHVDLKKKKKFSVFLGFCVCDF